MTVPVLAAAAVPGRAGAIAATLDPAAVRNRLDRAVTALETALNSSSAGLEDGAARLVAEATAAGLDHLAGRGRLVIADLRGRQGRVAECGRLAREVLRSAERRADPLLAARAQAVLAWQLWLTGLVGEALEAGVQSVRLLPADAPAHLRIDHAAQSALLNAQQLADTGYRAEFARLRVEAEALGDPDLLLAVLNNAAWLEHTHGHPAAAERLTTDLRATARRTGVVLSTTPLDTIAVVALATGRLHLAEQTARELASPDAVHTGAEGPTRAMVTVSEVLRRRGRSGEAMAAVLGALVLSAGGELLDARAAALRQQALLLAERGDHRAAYEVFETFLATEALTRSRAAAARAAVVRETGGIVETDRRTAVFAELASRDALTGVRNRRGLEDELAVLVDASRRSGALLSLAFVDLDRFKAVNDECSHEAGDAVLVAVARALVSGSPRGAAVGRLGGEEFVLVLPGLDEAAAVRVCRQLREQLARLPWPALTGGRPVTASFGVATRGDGVEDPVALTRAADRQVYRAKRAGRDRVAWSGDGLPGEPAPPVPPGEPAPPVPPGEPAAPVPPGEPAAPVPPGEPAGRPPGR